MYVASLLCGFGCLPVRLSCDCTFLVILFLQSFGYLLQFRHTRNDNTKENIMSPEYFRLMGKAAWENGQRRAPEGLTNEQYVWFWEGYKAAKLAGLPQW
jgi:hypothetical protein